jgi:hypothetical protein
MQKKCITTFTSLLSAIGGLTIQFANLLPRAFRGSSAQKPQYGMMTLPYQHLLLSECVFVCRCENVGA